MEVASEYFRSGADKISIGSDAVYAAEEYLRTGVCFPIFNSLTIHANLHASLCMSVCMCVPFDKLCYLFQVKTGKTSLEQISRVYGNQVNSCVVWNIWFTILLDRVVAIVTYKCS